MTNRFPSAIAWAYTCLMAALSLLVSGLADWMAAGATAPFSNTLSRHRLLLSSRIAPLLTRRLSWKVTIAFPSLPRWLRSSHNFGGDTNATT